MAHKTQFHQVPERPDFPKEEEKILHLWEQINAFQKQLELTKDYPKFTFYDGPPFATGLPHYGHICAGTIKDIVGRYFSQNGRHVERRFGWDCHGLPVEHEIDKLLNIKHRNDVLDMGIEKYNKECRSIVMKYSSEWRRIIGRTGRWVDFDRDYKTLDCWFMESVWWVFKQMWEKKLVYRGCKVMPYSNACSTVLSNFETQQNYKEVVDPAIIVNFPLVTDPNTKFVAWTTTPWTLPSNLALAVNPKFEYVKVKDLESGVLYILLEARLGELYPEQKNKKKAYEIVEKLKGEQLVGLEYTPLFNYFLERKNDGCFKVLGADFVTNSDGTGIVHMAPGFGDDDYKTCLKAGIIQPANPLVPVDSSGRFTEQVTDFQGLWVKDADKEIRKMLRASGRLVKDDQVRHNYPFCWRSDTPLIYKAVNCWFIKVTSLKDDLVANNKKARWVPSNIQEGRFNNWLEDAQDWCFSRNRFWGNPIPIWASEDFEELVCIGSIQELKDLSGVQDITDLHRENIDKITIPSKTGKGVLRRIEEVFDCWFESGSMPFAQQHYPFKNQEEFENIFPADFIAEGIDQTRGWFYTLNVISTALRNDAPYKNLIVNGIVLNDKGEKMSKRKQNYPDPEKVINIYGADAMRLYLINSGLVKAQSLNFKEEGVSEVIKNVFLPWYNAYRFLIQNVTRFEDVTGQSFVFDEKNINQISNQMDKWIVSTSQNLIKFVRNEMENYRLYTIIPELISYLDQFTNWYLRLNRLRLKGEHGKEDWMISLTVLFDVLFKITVLMSPYVPFITDSFYQNLRKCMPNEQAESIHFIQIPVLKPELIDNTIEKKVKQMQDVVECARKLRETNKISFKQPVSSLYILTTDEQLIESITSMMRYVEEEINTPRVVIEKDVQQYLELKAEPENRICGKELKDKFSKDLINQVRTFTQAQIQQLKKEGKLNLIVKIQKEKQVQQQEQEVDQKKKTKKKVEFEEIEVECELLLTHVIIKESFNAAKVENLVFTQEDGFSLLMDPRQDQKLKNMGHAREFTNRIQKLRKKAGLQQDDKVLIFYSFDTESEFSLGVTGEFQHICQQVKKPILDIKLKHFGLEVLEQEVCEVDGCKFNLVITKYGNLFNTEKLLTKYSQEQINMIIKTLSLFNVGQHFEFVLDGQLISLGKDEYYSPE